MAKKKQAEVTTAAPKLSLPEKKPEPKWGHPVLDDGITLLNGVARMYATTYAFMLQSQEALRSMSLTNEQAVDLSFICREMSEKCDDLRKEFNRIQQFAAAIVNGRIANQFLEEIGTLSAQGLSVEEHAKTDPKVKGLLCTGTISTKKGASLPKSDAPEWKQLLEDLGIPADVIARGLVKDLHWDVMTGIITERMAQGKPNLRGLSKTFDLPSMRLVRHRGVMFEDPESLERQRIAKEKFAAAARQPPPAPPKTEHIVPSCQ